LVNPQAPPPPIEGTSKPEKAPDVVPGAHSLPVHEGERMRQGGAGGAPAPVGGHAQQIHVASTLHIPPIEVQHKDGSGGILSRDFYPVTSVPVPTGVGRSALV
jgi:hypothetical protein